MTLSLDTLPPELLSQIVAHIDNARTLVQFSLTCKRLHEYTQSDGFRVFVQNRFPSLQTPPHCREAAHALTTLSRNWDRKAFVARFIAPPKPPPLNGSHKPSARQSQRRVNHQTMGYQPVINSYEVWEGGDWSSRKEVVVWGAGAELVVRKKSTGPGAEQAWHAQETTDGLRDFDQHHHLNDWFVYRQEGTFDGKDDIVSANLIPSVCDSEHVIVGRASGLLHSVSIAVHESRSHSIAAYDTRGRSLRSATLSRDSHPLLAACLADNAVALYPTEIVENLSEPKTRSAGGGICPLDEVAAIPQGTPGRTWSSKFLRNDRLAIGRGPSGQPILIYGIGQAGFSKSPIRALDVRTNETDKVDPFGRTTPVPATSIYPIEPIGPSSMAGGAQGDIFLSGGYDGNVRLHDLRTPASATGIFEDTVDNSAIYSLLAFGRERFVAGASRHCMLKVFDLRMPGGKMYHYTDALTHVGIQDRSKGLLDDNTAKWKATTNYHPKELRDRSHNYNMYLGSNPNESRPLPRTRADSPVYSLSAPSPCSPWFYAGIENAVVQLDVVSARDMHPDPVFSSGLQLDGTSQAIIDKWDPRREATTLRMYEHETVDSAEPNLGLMTQNRVHGYEYMEAEGGGQWDERWRHVS